MKQLIFGLLLSMASTAYAQDGQFESLYVTPGITAGFTFGATFNIGINLDFTTSTTDDYDKYRRAGVSLGYYLVLSKGGFRPHHIANLNLMYENEYMDVRGGYGFVTYRWGRAQINRAGIGGFSTDISFTNREARIPWFGLKSLFFNRSEWIWYDIPYMSIYARQQL